MFDYPVPHDNSQGLTAIETGRIYKWRGEDGCPIQLPTVITALYDHPVRDREDRL